jgi:ribose transport system permease protein
VSALDTATPAGGQGRAGPPVPALLFVGSLALYIVVALWTGETRMLEADGIVGLLQRMVGLGIVALGQTFVIIGGSIDLSVANMISVAAVLASFVMQGHVDMMLPAVVIVVVIAAIVGLANGLIITRLQVNPLIATLGVGLILQGLLSASFTNFAGSVPPEFQLVAYSTFGVVPFSVIGLFVLAALCAWLLRATRFGAHLYAVGGNVEGARLAGVRTNLVLIGAHVICSLSAGLTGLYLASRLRSGAPWVGRDGVYDLESIAVVVIGGTLLAGGRGGVWGTLAGVLLFATLDVDFNMLGVSAYPQLILRGAIVILAVAAYTFRSRGHVA